MKLPPKYRSLQDFMSAQELTLPRNEDWRLCERHVGQVLGLPGSRGVLTATNGVLCYIEQADGRLFLGHLNWFVNDRGERAYFDNKSIQMRQPKVGRVSKFDSLVAEYI